LGFGLFGPSLGSSSVVGPGRAWPRGARRGTKRTFLSPQGPEILHICPADLYLAPFIRRKMGRSLGEILWRGHEKVPKCSVGRKYGLSLYVFGCVLVCFFGPRVKLKDSFCTSLEGLPENGKRGCFPAGGKRERAGQCRGEEGSAGARTSKGVILGISFRKPNLTGRGGREKSAGPWEDEPSHRLKDHTSCFIQTRGRDDRQTNHGRLQDVLL